MKKYILAAMIAACIAPADMSAQFGRNQGQRPAMERVESLKKVRMMEALKLDENQSVKLLARYNKHRETMHSIESEAGEIYNKLEGQIEANASEGEINQSIGALLEFDRKKYDARSKFVGELRDVLTTKQIGEYLLFERNFARDLRQAVRDVKMDKIKSK